MIDAGLIPDVSALSVNKPEWIPTARQLTNTAVGKEGTIDISGNNTTVTLTVNKSGTLQEIWGFGASITGPAVDLKEICLRQIKTTSDINVNMKGLVTNKIGGRITNEQYDFASTKNISSSPDGDFIVRIPAKSVISIAEK
jgi:hypothetical protein